MKIEKKITVKGVCGQIKLQRLMGGLAENQTIGDTVPLMTVIGIARRYTVVQSDKGESIKFLGNFKATNLETGEVTQSGACFLPGALPDMLFGAIGENAEREVQFGFKIGAHFDESAITKYVYDVESLMPMSENDPLALLESAIARGVPLLTAVADTAPVADPVAAPASEPEPEPKPEPEPVAVKKKRAA